MFGSNVADLQQFVLLHLKINFASIATGNPIQDNAAEVLSRLYQGGVRMSERHKQAIRLGGIDIDRSETPQKTVRTDGRAHLWLFPEQAEAAKARKKDPQEKAEAYMDRVPLAVKQQWASVQISRNDWVPESIDSHTPEFRDFIKSHFPRFDRLKFYLKFYLYIEQARRWLDEDTSIEDYRGEEQRRYATNEMARIEENRLYGMNKYGYIKDDEMPGGRRKYYASAPQALIVFLLDCGYSLEIGKGRQAAITSTVMLYEALTLMVRTSYKGVLVTDDVGFTGKAIFNDKLKACALFLKDRNAWMYPPAVPNWADTKIAFDWSGGSTKDEKKLFSSEYSVAASDDTQTINGTTPSKVVFDEAQNIPTYVAIKLEARPTMLTSDSQGNISIKRQIVAYGTGSSNQRGKGAFEGEYKSTIARFFRGDKTESGKEKTSTFVPLFLDWTCRPNMTTSRYNEEYMFYLSDNEGDTAGLSREERTAQFHAAYPSQPEDMFLTSHKTIIPSLLIKKHLDRIYDECHSKGLAPKPGRFEPIYDMSRPMPDGSYLPYYVRDARWVPSSADDFEAPIRMLIDRTKGWSRRYVKGTDPIQSPTGNSKFASLVIDRAGYIGESEGQRIFQPVVACVLNWKSPVTDENFLQSALMNLYYSNHGKRGCMELFEVNQGQAYEKFMCSPFIDLQNSLWLRMALPQRYRGGGHQRGVGLKSGNKGGSKSALYSDVRNGFLDMGQGVWYYELFSQAQNVVVEEKDGGGLAYYPRNKNVDNDDLLDAFGFALISSECEVLDPVEVGIDNPAKKRRTIWDRDPRNPTVLIEREIEIPVRY